MAEKIDLLIIGAGFAGLSAAIYAARYNLKALIIGNEWGGLITTTHLVENYPGYKSLSGIELMDKFKEHVDYYKVPYMSDFVTKIEKKGEGKFFAKTEEGKEVEAKAVVIATGTKRKKLNVPGENELANKGVSYCATCDGILFRGKKVVVVGGSDSAAKEALLLSEFCESVTVLARSTLHPEPINAMRVKEKKNIIVLEGVEVKEIIGKKLVEKIALKNGKEIPCSAVFIEVGHTAMTELAEMLKVKLDEKKEIMVDRYARTNVNGVFGAGDCCDTKWKQGIVSAAEGAHAANSAFEYLTENSLVE